MKNATERPRNMIEIMETDRCCETMVKFERHGSKGALKAGFVQPPTPNSHQKAI